VLVFCFFPDVLMCHLGARAKPIAIA
jgi:uncharacterized protein (DUF488 family)